MVSEGLLKCVKNPEIKKEKNFSVLKKETKHYKSIRWD